ncbi:hypothetical protein VH441_02805 [Psychrobacter sp. HD31]|uniref:hypothetical protein n=1 Tax=Psychrobacter sp. HD31 TaxID=3112003 RepID=UPI003DA25E37
MTSFKLKALLKYPFNSKKRKTYRSTKTKEMKFKKFHRNAPEALRILSSAFEEYNKHNKVNVWLSFGTLLGAYRDSAIITHDYDIDFGIDEQSFSMDFLNFIANYDGFKLVKIFKIHSSNIDLNDFISEATLSYKDCVNIDFFVFKNKNDKKIVHWFEMDQSLSRKRHYEKYGNQLRVCQCQFTDFSLSEIEFLGNKFNVPSDIVKHLTERYGADFMTPKKYSYDNRPRDFERLLDDQNLATEYYF